MERKIMLVKISSFIFFISLLFFPGHLFSQTQNSGILKGKLVDTASQQLADTTLKQSLKGATIAILNSSDSSLVRYDVSEENGSFQLENIPLGNYIVRITFLGYEEIGMKISLSREKKEHNAGTLYLQKKEGILEAVIVKAVAVVIKGDTTEFNASFFKTIPNASTEDLLKKLPGVEVERDGTIKTQGETVTRILVDGKRFFGNDPKMATRNLPADIIDKIQVIDAKSDQSAFSGIDDGDRVRTINITTKKDRKKGLFGKASAAAGNEGRNAFAISANRINGDQRISFIGQRNNINNQNFSIQDFLGSMSQGGGGGGGGRSGGSGGANVFAGGSSGISTTTGGGLNYNDAYGKNTDVSASYFYNNINTTNNRDRYKETFVINDSSLFNTNNLLSRYINENHRFDFEVNHNFDSANSILVRSNYSHQTTSSVGQTKSYTTKGVLKALSEVNAVNSSNNFGYNLSNSVLLRHRFKKRGRTISINILQNSNTNERYSDNFSDNDRFTRGRDTTDQISNTLIDGKSIGANVSYTEALGLKGILELTYNYNESQSHSDQQTFKLDKTTGLHSIEVTNLTNRFENSNISHRGGANYRRQINTQWNYSLGMAVSNTDLVSNNLSKSTFMNQSFINLFPNLDIQFKQSRLKNFRFNYRGSTIQPNIVQLQDVVNNTNVLNIRSGNPSLKQAFSNNVTLTYNYFNRKTFRNLFISITGSSISNKIANTTILNTTQDSLLVDGYYLIPGAQFTKPRNLDGAYNISSNVNYGFATTNPKTNINLTSRFSYNRDVNLFNDVKSFTHNYVIGGTVRVTMNLKEYLDLNFSSSSTYNIARYEIQPKQNGNYFNQRFSAEPTLTTKNGWMLSNDFDYIISRGQSAGFNQAIPLWNAGLAKLFGKARLGELRVTVFDILNTNKSFTRNVEQNYVEDVRTDVLNRYFLVSFTYHLRKFKGKQKSGNESFIKPERQNGGRGNGNNGGNGGGNFRKGRNE
ncbi:MAG TPA: outer membrane beta-barrel protein [Chitinophagaceae bacterium]